eukprot:5126163-Pyramimonas_sp.AAC.3
MRRRRMGVGLSWSPPGALVEPSWSPRGGLDRAGGLPRGPGRGPGRIWERKRFRPPTPRGLVGFRRAPIYFIRLPTSWCRPNLLYPSSDFMALPASFDRFVIWPK